MASFHLRDMKIFLPAALAALVVAGCGRKDAPAEQPVDIVPSGEAVAALNAALEANGISIAFEKGSSVYVIASDDDGRFIVCALGMAARAEQPSDPGFPAIRSLCLNKALHDANFNFSAFLDETITEETPAKDQKAVIRSVDTTLMGGQVLCMAECRSSVGYEVAVAVCWSSEGMDAMRRHLDNPVQSDASAVMAWLAGKDFSDLHGPRSFTDSSGTLRLLGIGMANAQRPNAMDKAYAEALGFSTYSFPTKVRAWRKTTRSLSARAKTTSHGYEETLEREPRSWSVVLKTTFDDASSGCKMAVVVVEAIP